MAKPIRLDEMNVAADSAAISPGGLSRSNLVGSLMYLDQGQVVVVRDGEGGLPSVGSVAGRRVTLYNSDGHPIFTRMYDASFSLLHELRYQYQGDQLIRRDLFAEGRLVQYEKYFRIQVKSRTIRTEDPSLLRQVSEITTIERLNQVPDLAALAGQSVEDLSGPGLVTPESGSVQPLRQQNNRNGQLQRQWTERGSTPTAELQYNWNQDRVASLELETSAGSRTIQLTYSANGRLTGGNWQDSQPPRYLGDRNRTDAVRRCSQPGG